MAEMTTVYLMIGSNIEPGKNVQRAIEELQQHFTVNKLSSVYQSPAFGPLADQPDFLNRAVQIQTMLSPIEVKEILLGIEEKLGRNRAAQKTKFDPRTLDLDIMLWGDHAFTFGHKPWEIPDENILKQAAVALPLAELAPDYIHPQTQQSLTQIARTFQNADIQRLE